MHFQKSTFFPGSAPWDGPGMMAPVHRPPLSRWKESAGRSAAGQAGGVAALRGLPYRDQGDAELAFERLDALERLGAEIGRVE